MNISTPNPAGGPPIVNIIFATTPITPAMQVFVSPIINISNGSTLIYINVAALNGPSAVGPTTTVNQVFPLGMPVVKRSVRRIAQHPTGYSKNKKNP